MIRLVEAATMARLEVWFGMENPVYLLVYIKLETTRYLSLSLQTFFVSVRREMATIALNSEVNQLSNELNYFWFWITSSLNF